jgi:hypothetical protein
VSAVHALADIDGVVSPTELAETIAAIESVQLPSGMIPWFPGGHADPWNHVEAAMALSLGGHTGAAERAYEWLARSQHPDGSWCLYYLTDGIEEPRRDPNVCSYIAVGVWQHLLVTGDRAFADALWPTVERAIDWSLDLQRPGGEITWSMDPDGTRGRFALLTSSSSIYLSLRCAVALADRLGHERPDWELAAGRLRHALVSREHVFEPKRRWAMDWYYPVLCGALRGDDAQTRLTARWTKFVIDGRGVRCVADRPWVTAAETAECVMALDAAGLDADASRLFAWVQSHRHEDGSYWTGTVYPEEVHFPGGERSTYTSAAVVLAANALAGTGPTAGLFRGEGLPTGLDLDDASEDAQAAAG